MTMKIKENKKAPLFKLFGTRNTRFDLKKIKSKSKARVIRDGTVVYNGEILSLFREKNQVKEVATGLECGISIKNFIDFKEKDVIESYLSEKIQRSI